MLKKISVIAVLFIALVGIPTAFLQSSPRLRINNLLPERNPCDQSIFPDDSYEEFKEAVGVVLRSPVISSIAREVKKYAGEDPRFAETDINIVDKEAFALQFFEDINELLSISADAAVLEANTFYEIYGAYTYLTDNYRNGYQRMRISFFCNEDIDYRTMKNTLRHQFELYRLVIHELVHIEILAMLSLGRGYQDLPFQGHGDAFDREEERLFELLIDWLDETGQIKEEEITVSAVVEKKAPVNEKLELIQAGKYFYDVVPDSWYEGTVYDLAKRGIISGYRDSKGNLSGFFGPYDNATRGELVKICVAALNINPPSTNRSSFVDIDQSYFAFDHINYAVEQGWVSGYNSRYFGPNDPVTRGQAAKIISNCLDLPKFSKLQPSFADVPIGHVFYEYIEGLKLKNIVSGYADGMFHSESPIVRAEIAAIIQKGLTAVNN